MAEKRKRTKKSNGDDAEKRRADAMIDPPKAGATEERTSAAAAPPAKKRAPRKKATAKQSTEAEKEVSIESTLEEEPISRTSADLPKNDIDRLLAGEHSNPHAILGAHSMSLLGESGVMIRALIPSAERVECVLESGEVLPMTREAEGLADL